MSKPYSEPPCPHAMLRPGNAWADCLCDEVDPSDVPCAVCEVHAYTREECSRCKQAKQRKERVR